MALTRDFVLPSGRHIPLAAPCSPRQGRAVAGQPVGPAKLHIDKMHARWWVTEVKPTTPAVQTLQR